MHQVERRTYHAAQPGLRIAELQISPTQNVDWWSFGYRGSDAGNRQLAAIPFTSSIRLGFNGALSTVATTSSNTTRSGRANAVIATILCFEILGELAKPWNDHAKLFSR